MFLLSEFIIYSIIFINVFKILTKLGKILDFGIFHASCLVKKFINFLYFSFQFTHGNQKAQKYLLGGLEQVINLHKDTLMSKVPHILKLFYDTDILEEEVLIDWSQKVWTNFFCISYYLSFSILNSFRTLCGSL